MRIATWNVNSLKARLEKVTWWLDRAKPDVLLMQETKLADADAPTAVFDQAGYALAHHGEGRWNGVAIASRCGIDAVVDKLWRATAPCRDGGDRRRRTACRSADDLSPLRRRARRLRVRAERPSRGVAIL